MKYFIQTFGCQMNVADSEEISRALVLKGFEPAPSLDDAELAVINTCTVRQHAEDKALSFLGRMSSWKQAGQGRILVFAGCAAERLKDEIKKRFSHIDLIVSAKDIEYFGEIVEGEIEGNRDSEGRKGAVPIAHRTSFVTIMRGCNRTCSFCIVPGVRGKEKYRSPEEILAEIKEKISYTTHITLLGQTVNSYRFPPFDFADLLKEVDNVSGLGSFDFMSPHPIYVTDRVIEILAQLNKWNKCLHLPVQSGSDKILMKMRRGYTRQRYLELISRVRAAMPDVKISTDFIVGFPGEDENDFSLTLSLAEETGFNQAFCFKYSSRPGTEAGNWEDDVPQKTKEERLGRLLNTVKSGSRDLANISNSLEAVKCDFSVH